MLNRLIITTSFLFLSIISLSGQKLVNSPYSRFNLGTMEPAGSFRSLGMGGIGVALRDNNSIYFNNPASYSSIDTNSFVFDFGIDYSMNFLSDGESGYFSDDVNFDHLLIGFPLAKGFGFAMGLYPFSNGYYKMSTVVSESDPGYNPITGGYSVLHQGEGGLTNFFAGTGITIFRKFSAGVNMTVLFGQINRSNRFVFADFENVLHNNSTEKLQVGGVNFDLGVQYFTQIKEDYFMRAGLSVTAGSHFKSTYENFSYLYSSFSSIDTLSFISNNDDKVYLPKIYRAGISFGRKNKFVIGADYISARWSKAVIPGSDGYLTDTRSFLFGAEYIPEKYSNFSIAKRFEYRIGGHIENNYLILNGEKIKEFGVSAGVGLPMRRSLSRTNVFVDFTRKGSPKVSGLHAENYVTMGVSLNLYDFWFIKRKYD